MSHTELFESIQGKLGNLLLGKKPPEAVLPALSNGWDPESFAQKLIALNAVPKNAIDQLRPLLHQSKHVLGGTVAVDAMSGMTDLDIYQELNLNNGNADKHSVASHASFSGGYRGSKKGTLTAVLREGPSRFPAESMEINLKSGGNIFQAHISPRHAYFAVEMPDSLHRKLYSDRVYENMWNIYDDLSLKFLYDLEGFNSFSNSATQFESQLSDFSDWRSGVQSSVLHRVLFRHTSKSRDLVPYTHSITMGPLAVLRDPVRGLITQAIAMHSDNGHLTLQHMDHASHRSTSLARLSANDGTRI